MNSVADTLPGYKASSWLGLTQRRRIVRIGKVPWLFGEIDHPALVQPKKRVVPASRQPGVYDHLRNSVLDLVDNERISRTAALRAVRQLISVLSPDSVFPHISADENGEVTVYWFADGSRLELSIPDRGGIYCHAVSEDMSSIGFEGFYDRLSDAPVREFVGYISDLISSKNPDWRQAFTS